MPILGLGHDVVDVAAFSEQLGEPGGGMRRLFSARELRQASMRARVKHDGEAVHLAARWAGKEAVLKAWCEALGDGPAPYTLDDFPWASIEILDDSQGRPQVALSTPVQRILEDSLSPFGDNAEPDLGATVASRSASPDDDAANKAMSSQSAELLTWHISLSHDGPIASAVVILEALKH
ncbi:holo-ACP synthase [Bifidobacterium callimiconis]|uniref:Holo-[acyl-carrier-protein] synthase n=1 Tax=Bifidobacterium callimiconis TaxID=2306973 RepID=A0A430F7X2_9BIFI|nr:holo-ACP synthase [Bifidobacterium callimiconis]MBT1177786.1 holo-ACP synthase [Bifidobacterium callimiconis]RSX48024.1 ACP synthase [Bifidobacterium callimiconis]